MGQVEQTSKFSERYNTMCVLLSNFWQGEKWLGGWGRVSKQVTRCCLQICSKQFERENHGGNPARLCNPN